MELIIFPTEKCNFRCTYCYESFNVGRMKPALQEAVCRLISQRKDLQRLDINWFGGEPLAGFPVIRKIGGFTYEFTQAHGIDFCSGMTTNGYLLGQDTALWLIDHGIRNFQISLDGDEESHDRTRRRADGGGSFGRIMANLTAMAGLKASFRVMLRVHYHRENLESVCRLIDLLAERFAGDGRFGILFRKVSPLGGENDAQFPFMTDAGAMVRAERDFIDRVGGRIDVVNADTPESPYVCYACKPTSLAIRADGRLAKCTVALDHDGNTIGRLRENGTLEMDQEKHRAWIRPLLEGTDEDRACPVSMALAG